MIKLILSAVVGAAIVIVAEILFVCLGGIAMDTKGKALPLEKFLAHRALGASIGKHAADPSPVPADAENVMAGAKIYSKSCAACHGELNQGKPPFALGEYPADGGMILPYLVLGAENDPTPGPQ